MHMHAHTHTCYYTILKPFFCFPDSYDRRKQRDRRKGKSRPLFRFSNCKQGSGPRGTLFCRIQGIYVRPSIVWGPCLQGVGLGALARKTLAWGPMARRTLARRTLARRTLARRTLARGPRPGVPGLGSPAWGPWPGGSGLEGLASLA